MNKLNIVNQAPVVTIVFFVIAVGLGALILWPKYQALSEVQGILNLKEQMLQGEEQHFINLEQIKERLSDYESQLANIEASLPDDPSFPSIFNFIQSASAQSGLALAKISPFASVVLEENENIKESEFSIEVIGSYSSLKDFVSTLENSSRMIEVENISFSFPKKGESFTFNLKVKVFSY